MDATEYVRLLFTYTEYLAQKPGRHTVASAPTVTGSVFMRRISLFLGQWGESVYFWDSGENQFIFGTVWRISLFLGQCGVAAKLLHQMSGLVYAASRG